MTSRSSTAIKLPMKALAPSWALVSLIKFPGAGMESSFTNAGFE
jgi:hypothetical protein